MQKALLECQKPALRATVARERGEPHLPVESRHMRGREPRSAVEVGLHDPLAGGQLGRGEEAGAAVGHGQQRLTVDAADKTEAEQVGVALAKEPVNVDVVTDRLSRAGQTAVEGHDGRALRQSYAVEATPKLMVIDANGMLRGSWVGWGEETRGAVLRELRESGATLKK